MSYALSRPLLEHPSLDPKTTVYAEGVLYDVDLSLGESLTRRSDESLSTKTVGIVYIKCASDASTRAPAHRERRVPNGTIDRCPHRGTPRRRDDRAAGGRAMAPWRRFGAKTMRDIFSVTIRARAGATTRGRRRKRRRLAKGEWCAVVVIGTRAMTGGD